MRVVNTAQSACPRASASGRLRNEFYCVDRAVAGPQLVPVLSLGCRLEVRSCAADAGASAQHWYVLARREDAGGRNAAACILAPRAATP